MDNILVVLLDFTKVIDFKIIIYCTFIYLLVFWIAVSAWVYSDVRKRYKSKYLGIIIGFCVFLLSFPALILYLVFRRGIHEEDEVVNAMYEIENVHIPTIPLANFQDKDGDVKFRVEVTIVPHNSIQSQKVKNEGDDKNDNSIQITLRDYIASISDGDSDIDKRIRKNINKLLGMIKMKKKYDQSKDNNK